MEPFQIPPVSDTPMSRNDLTAMFSRLFLFVTGFLSKSFEALEVKLLGVMTRQFDWFSSATDEKLRMYERNISEQLNSYLQGREDEIARYINTYMHAHTAEVSTRINTLSDRIDAMSERIDTMLTRTGAFVRVQNEATRSSMVVVVQECKDMMAESLQTLDSSIEMKINSELQKLNSELQKLNSDFASEFLNLETDMEMKILELSAVQVNTNKTSEEARTMADQTRIFVNEKVLMMLIALRDKVNVEIPRMSKDFESMWDIIKKRIMVLPEQGASSTTDFSCSSSSSNNINK